MKYRKTEAGRQSYKDHSNALTGRQRSAFILMDGLKDDSVILKALAPTGLNNEDIQHLIDLGLIEPHEPLQNNNSDGAIGGVSTGQAVGGEAPIEARSALSEQELYQRAYPVATKLTSGLGLRGFRLNLSLEATTSFKELVTLAPKIREAVGDEKFAELARALRNV
jgi:hypothetical protein